jgi:arylsulfatase A-like enzyme
LARNFGPETVGGLRGAKGSLWEGGIRVPAIIEWPKGVKPRVTMHPARILDAARAFATFGVQD